MECLHSKYEHGSGDIHSQTLEEVIILMFWKVLKELNGCVPDLCYNWWWRAKSAGEIKLM
jgi:hypothetical protein